MKKYEIEINNEVYHVTVRELPADTEMTVKEEDIPKENTSNQVTDESSEPTIKEDSTIVKAPMAGTILAVNVSPGQKIVQGETLIVLEAMKMENEIVAPVDGVVEDIYVSKNERVESDQVLLSL
ncbi:MAG TPA: biotin/lipoyl-containing protein [Atopostipes sp.]|nr:biotin/lipoyl-containing protein [Atopostipes sp.]